MGRASAWLVYELMIVDGCSLHLINTKVSHKFHIVTGTTVSQYPTKFL